MKQPIRILALCLTLIMVTFLINLSVSLTLAYDGYEKEHFKDSDNAKNNKENNTFNLFVEAGDYEMSQNRYEEARNEYLQALDIYPDNRSVLDKIETCDSLLGTSSDVIPVWRDI